jgi:hypothetical protein
MSSTDQAELLFTCQEWDNLSGEVLVTHFDPFCRHTRKPTQEVAIMPEQSVEEAARTELMMHGVPMPADVVKGLSPVAVLVFLREWCLASVGVLAGAFADPKNEIDPVTPVVDEVLNGVTAGLVGAVHALVALEVMPPEAEEAMTIAAALDGQV